MQLKFHQFGAILLHLFLGLETQCPFNCKKTPTFHEVNGVPHGGQMASGDHSYQATTDIKSVSIKSARFVLRSLIDINEASIISFAQKDRLLPIKNKNFDFLYKLVGLR